ncbi:GNAT family N-acetyltransferase [Paenibacillus kandeliae]|uniref:GNAT family N-acetyltransferase n=1 Tax=Paenibacillus kandeliae TaxID=3231269 RepID=UPI003459C13F
MKEVTSYQDGPITIRPAVQTDSKTLWRLAYEEAAPEWKKWDAPYYEHVPLTYEQFIEKQQESWIDNDARWVIEVDGNVIGMVSYYWEHQPSWWLEMGIVIFDPAYWNGGYGTKALRLWIGHLFTILPLVRVGYTTWSGNDRMVQVGYKLGMTMEARLRKCRLYNGVYYDSIRMGMLREEWEARANQ